MGKSRLGYCRLCGQYGKLSYEHVPPESAFNKEPRAFMTFRNMVDGRSRTKFRQGLGAYTLCEKCNNLTGAWYGGAFAEWTRQGLEGLEKIASTGEKSIVLPYYVRPLNVIKQVVVMALALGDEQTIGHSGALRRFALNREQKYLPTSDRIYVYHSLQGQPRFESGMVVMNISNRSASYVRGEIALPPFGYVVSDPVPNMQDMGAAEGLCEITWFAEYDYNKYAHVNLRIPGLETHTAVPLDYRTKVQMAQEAEKALQAPEETL